jgi:3-hydroxybutyryl-CoA dehydrogenase
VNPVPIMKLVEIITGLQTSKTTLDTTLALAASMGKVSQATCTALRGD